MADPVLLVHAATTWFMAGVIWFVQVVHYPLFAGVGDGNFANYAGRHARQTTWVVLPAMVLELATAVWLAITPPPDLSRGLTLVGLALVALLWASTFLLQVPLHRRLRAGFDEAAHRRLVVGNWFRTALWSMRSVLVLLMIR